MLLSGAVPTPAVSRLQVRGDVTGPLGVVLDSPDVLWAGRTTVNPVHRLAPPEAWQVHDSRPEGRSATAGQYVSATSHSTGARLEVIGADRVVLRVPLSGSWIDITFTLPPTVADGGAPVVITADAAAAMRSVLAIAAGADGPEALPEPVNGATTVTVDWDPERVADPPVSPPPSALRWRPPSPRCPTPWSGGAGRRCSRRSARPSPIPASRSSRACSAWSTSTTPPGCSPLPDRSTQLVVTATSSVAIDTDIGRVVPVTVNERHRRHRSGGAGGTFAIRGRTGAA